MASRKLPPELEEEILIWVPTQSLARLRTVCKEWNTLFNDQRFINKHSACDSPNFILQSNSDIYSISVNLNDEPTIKVRCLTFGFLGSQYGNCDGHFFSYDSDKGGVDRVVWNPRLLRHSNVKLLNANFMVDQSLDFNNVSLNGNVYWTAYNLESHQHLIRIFDISKKIITTFCNLPCKEGNSSHTHVLTVYKRDRFSLLEQCKYTGNVEIWVTKKKISNGDAVEWNKFMTVSKPNIPRFNHRRSSYFVDNNIFGKSFVMCCTGKETKQACIYIVRKDMCKKIDIDNVFSHLWCSVYIPRLIPVPRETFKRS